LSHDYDILWAICLVGLFAMLAQERHLIKNM